MPEEKKPSGTDAMSKIKIGILVILGLVMIIFLLSNLDKMELKFLFGLLKMDGPQAFFIFLFMLFGFAAGFVTCLVWLRHLRLKTPGDRSDAAEQGGGQDPGTDKP